MLLLVCHVIVSIEKNWFQKLSETNRNTSRPLFTDLHVLCVLPRIPPDICCLTITRWPVAQRSTTAMVLKTALSKPRRITCKLCPLSTPLGIYCGKSVTVPFLLSAVHQQMINLGEKRMEGGRKEESEHVAFWLKQLRTMQVLDHHFQTVRKAEY